MPGLPDAAEAETLRRKMDSHGKTCHVWKTGVFGEPPDALPLGPAHLAWSFNRDGEAKLGMIEARDTRQDLDPAEARRDRRLGLARAPPSGGERSRRSLPEREGRTRGGG